MVSDIEIVYVPHVDMVNSPFDMFALVKAVYMDDAIRVLEAEGILERRVSATGHTMYGPKIKLMRHVRSDIPVDFFAATSATWWNIFTMRTGGKKSNMAVALAARRKGYTWKSSGGGFARLSDRLFVPVNSEADVFSFVGLPCLPPEQRQ